MIVHRPGYEQTWRADALLRAGQEIDVVAFHRRRDRRTLLAPVRKQLVQRGWLEDIAGENVRTDLRALFQYDD